MIFWKVVIGYALFLIVGVFMWSSCQAEEKYMKLDPEIGGYITITTQPCEIEAKKDEYSYKAIIQVGTGDSRRGCWYRAEPPHKGLVPMVLIVEEMEYDGKIIYNIGSFGQYYFKATKE